MKIFRMLLLVALASASLTLGCTGSDGKDGTNGVSGTNGTNGTIGSNGTNGGNVEVLNLMGHDALEKIDALTAVKATVSITGATAGADGTATVTFTVSNVSDGSPVTGLGTAGGASFVIGSLDTTSVSGVWVPYIYSTNVLDINIGYRERNAFTETGAGAYSYTFAQNLAAATLPVGGTAVTYDRARTHRVIVTLRSGYSGGTTYDFVPAGGGFGAPRHRRGCNMPEMPP